MEPTLKDVEWLRELANQDDPPEISIYALRKRGLTSGTREEFKLLLAEGCEFRQDIRDGTVWVNAAAFVRGCARVAAKMGPIVVH